MNQARAQKQFTILEAAADWHKLMLMQCFIMSTFIRQAGRNNTARKEKRNTQTHTK